MASCGFPMASIPRSYIFVLFVFTFFITASLQNPNHNHGHKSHRRFHLQQRDLTDSERVVEDALVQIRQSNKYRLNHPRRNNYSFSYANDPQAAASLSQTDNNTVLETEYTISPEVTHAAALLAESKKHGQLGNDAVSTTQQLKDRYWGERNGTRPESGSKQQVKRDDTSFWMENMEMNGESPFGPSGYKVFRNVMDYGAKGDGLTDDTAAINKAVSDDGRCGAGCKSSTVVPAVVYFPKGTYLVSSSIIQYYNTQFLGDPFNKPIILAASSFVGLGVISSDVYIEGGNGAQWYLNTNNFLRSVRNFVIDITNTDPAAYVCGLHWQVAQGTDLQNVDFYMKPGTTQQGIYMENGSGGFLSRLFFSGGNFGAYMGNQQFTSRDLIFHDCETAIQIHWDWGWTMKGIAVHGGETGVIIVGGAGGVNSNGQGVGAFLLTDSLFDSVGTGISTSLVADNSTSFLIQNSEFQDCPNAIMDADEDAVLLAGDTSVESWGFGLIVQANTTTSHFKNGGPVPAPDRKGELFHNQESLFTRDAPTYQEIPAEDIVNVKSYGAKGDGATDDGPLLNQILANAANASAVVFFPFGIYKVHDTVQIPIGSRIVGQAWSQIMGTGEKFQDQSRPQAVVQVGVPGDAGIVEISDMMVTVSGPTAGAVLLEWNIREASQGDAALWNTHMRVGGAAGSDLQAKDCPKKTGSVDDSCIAASLLMHVTAAGSGYFENMWVWTADHDLDIPSQEQIDVYTGRGILVEGKGPTWLWGSAAEHSVLYQYNLVGASDIFMGMIQTESPYFQPVPTSPTPFYAGVFAGDPLFTDCADNPKMCGMSWGLRTVQSENIYIYGAGLYSWFSDYSQECLSTGCQEQVLNIESSSNIWLYNLATKGTVEMVSPSGQIPTFAEPNQNGYLSSIIAWLEGSNSTVGGRNFTGFSLFPEGSLESSDISSGCRDALYQTVYCADAVKTLGFESYHGSLGNEELTDKICAAGCGRSLAQIHNSIATLCKATPELIPGLPTISAIYRYWWGYNDTCFKDPTTGKYCNDIIATYDFMHSAEDASTMPENQICSYCFVTKYQQMQQSPYAFYTNVSQDIMEVIQSRCDLSGSTEPTPPGIDIVANTTNPSSCASDQYYTVKDGDTCDSIATSHSVSAGTLWHINPSLLDCTDIQTGLELCLPKTCKTYQVQEGDDCVGLAIENHVSWISLVNWNPVLDYNCSNLVDPDPYWGTTTCVSPPGGKYEGTPNNASNSQTPHPGYAPVAVDPPAGADVANGTTHDCGDWYTFKGNQTCSEICLQNTVTRELFLAFNPSLSEEDCTLSLELGLTYCLHATRDWNYTATPNPWGGIGSIYHPGLPVTEDGNCGPDYGNATCRGGDFGRCCAHGKCSSTAANCDSETCLPHFGLCG